MVTEAMLVAVPVGVSVSVPVGEPVAVPVDVPVGDQAGLEEGVEVDVEVEEEEGGAGAVGEAVLIGKVGAGEGVSVEGVSVPESSKGPPRRLALASAPGCDGPGRSCRTTSV